MKRNDNRSRSEWADILLDWQKSGETQRGYCLRKSIRFSTFHYWRKKPQKENNDNSIVRVSNLAALPSVGGNTPTVRVGEIQVKLSGHESEELLARIFRALKAAL